MSPSQYADFAADPADADASAGRLIVRDLASMPYAAALELQKSLQQRVIAARERPAGPMIGYLLLVEHDPPVITISRRQTASEHLLATPQQLAAAGVEVASTDRGGDITYHGPGQLVAYPILDLNTLNLRMHSYLRFLEQVVIDTLGSFGIIGRRDPQATGVWVGSSGAASQPAKIAAMGVRVSRWVSMHGLALNVAPDLEHFNFIVPCGLHGRPVTSIAQQLGNDRCPSMTAVKHRLTQVFQQAVSEHSE